MACQKILPVINSNSLSFRVSSRGKALQNALSTIKNFDSGLDRFMRWLSEVEYKLASLEDESRKPTLVESDEKIRHAMRRHKVGCSPSQSSVIA
jgi:hypothetical protein